MSYIWYNNWPYNYTTFPSIVDHVDPWNQVYATGLHTEIENIENVLGKTIQGGYETVADRLDGLGPLIGSRPFKKTIGFTSDCDYVCDGDADDIQIQQALTETIGGTLIFREGTYTLTNMVNIYGSTTLKGAGYGTKIIQGVGINNSMLKCYNQSKVIIDGFYIDGGGDTKTITDGDIYILDSTNIIIANCFFANSKANAIKISGTSADIIITNNMFFGTGPYSMAITTGTRIVISNNSLYNRPMSLDANIESIGISNNVIYNGATSSVSPGVFLGYTQLGDLSPKIKIKKLTGTTAAAEGGTTDIAHGLTLSKVISITAVVQIGTTHVIPPNVVTQAELQYDVIIYQTNVTVTLHATNSGSILSKPVIITIIYEE